MLKDDFDKKFDRFTRGFVRRKVNQLIGRAGLTEQDREDLTHDLYLRVLQSLRRFNSDLGHRNTLSVMVSCWLLLLNRPLAGKSTSPKHPMANNALMAIR